MWCLFLTRSFLCNLAWKCWELGHCSPKSALFHNMDCLSNLWGVCILALCPSRLGGVVHANVGQNVTPHNPSLGLFLYHFFTYDELVTSRVNPQQHKQPTNITIMVMEPLAPPAAWIQWIYTVRVAGGLAHSFFKAAVEGFSSIQWINVESNIFASNLCLINLGSSAGNNGGQNGIHRCWRQPIIYGPALNIVIDIRLTHI